MKLWSVIWLTSNQSITSSFYRAYIAHQKEPIYEFSKESTFFHKFAKYGLFSTLQALYILILDNFIYIDSFSSKLIRWLTKKVSQMTDQTNLQDQIYKGKFIEKINK